MNGIDHYTAVPLGTSVSLLGQGRLASLGHRFQHGGGQLDWLTMLCVAVVLVVAIAVVWLVARHLRLKEEGGYHNHRSLFRELCRAHRLRWSDRRLLVLVARRQGVVVPARLFVEPERFEAGNLTGMKEAQQRRIDTLSETLFRSNADGVS